MEKEYLKMISDKSIWKPIPDTSGKYYVSKYGDVMSLCATTPKIIKQVKRGGYMRAIIRINGKRRNFDIHRLVAISFIPNPHNLPIVHHIDANKENNSVDNLKWVTQKDNVIESWKGRIISEETRRKLSLASKGRKKGKISEETRRKLSLARRKRIISEETKRKISLALKGRIFSEETRRKLSLALKGKKKGKMSEETKRKISEGMKNYIKNRNEQNR